MTSPALTRLDGHSAVTGAGVLRGEIIKLVTTPQIRGLTIAIVLCQVLLPQVSLLLTWGFIPPKFAQDTPLSNFSTMPLNLMLLLFGVFGAIAATADFRWGIINLSFLSCGSRRLLFITKILAVSCSVALITFVSIVIATAISSVLAIALSLPIEVTAKSFLVFLTVPLAHVLSALIGLAFGLALRSTLASTLIVLAIHMLVPLAASILMVTIGQAWAEWMFASIPSQVLQLTGGALLDTQKLPNNASLPYWWANALAAIGWTLLATVGSWFIFAKRAFGAGSR